MKNEADMITSLGGDTNTPTQYRQMSNQNNITNDQSKAETQV